MRLHRTSDGPPGPFVRRCARARRYPRAVARLGLALLVGWVLWPQAPAHAQWWRRKPTDAGTRYGIRFLALEGNTPVKAPLTRLRVGERHRIRVALYAIRNGELDASRQLAQGPRGSVTIRCESADTAVATVEPRESQITAGYDTAFAEFWLTGVSPGQTRVTARAALGGGAIATTWFGPVQVAPEIAATPKRLPPPPPRAAAAPAAEEPPTETVRPSNTKADERDVETRAPADGSQPDATPRPASVTTNPTAIAAAVGIPPSLPDTLKPHIAPPAPVTPQAVAGNDAAVESPVAPPVAPGPAPPEVQSPSASSATDLAPPSNRTGTIGETAVRAQPTIVPAVPKHLPPGSRGLLVSDDAAPRMRPESPPAPPAPMSPAPFVAETDLPCPRFSALTIRNVGTAPVVVQVRDSGVAASRSERLESGDTVVWGLTRGDTVWVEARRPDGERQGMRIRAAASPAPATLRLPAFAPEPWLEIRPTPAACAEAEQ